MVFFWGGREGELTAVAGFDELLTESIFYRVGKGRIPTYQKWLTICSPLLGIYTDFFRRAESLSRLL